MKKFRGHYKKPNPETVKKWVENNKKLYAKEIKSLKEIVAYNSKIKKKDNVIDLKEVKEKNRKQSTYV